MTLEIVAAESTKLFIGTDDAPRQVIHVVLRGTASDSADVARVTVEGPGLEAGEPITVGPLRQGEVAGLDVGVVAGTGTTPGETIDAEVVVADGSGEVRHQFALLVAEPGWRMFMVPHFHYDPVWWNTQAAYTETWGMAMQHRQPYQEPGLALVASHLEMARRDPDYKFVLAELDYLKPYWDAYPEDREYVRELLENGRLEFVGGTYNEPNTNLTSAESTIRNAIYGVGYQRDVLGGAPATAWQLDAFGHDPQFPGIMADAGISSSSWARGPFHEWGPHWVRGPGRMPFAELAAGPVPTMQFPMEFDWIAPSGRALLTSYMADHYSAGWWMDAALDLAAAEAEVYALFLDLAALSATKNVLLPVGTDYTPPNKWVTQIQRDWNSRYVWPKFITAIPREYFDAVRAEKKAGGRPFSPQTRDMNPIYTGKDVSFIDTKQAQRVAENTLLAAEKFGTIASLFGARFPAEAIDKAWRQLLFGAHHDGITGSESDQVYLDLLGGWREAVELGRGVLDGALRYLGASVDTTGDGVAVTVFNAMSWPRTDIARVEVDVPDGSAGIEVRRDGEDGSAVPFVVESSEGGDDQKPSRATITFLATDVPALGYRTFRIVPSDTPIVDSEWRTTDGTTIENEAFRVSVDPGRAGTIDSVLDKRTGLEILRPGEVGNELRVYREYPMHPLFGEGPWHLTPDGRFTSVTTFASEVVVETSPVGQRIRIDGPFEESRRSQEIRLWTAIDRVELATELHDYRGSDRLFRVRFPAAIEGGRPVSETGNAVIGRPFGRPNVNVSEVPFTLDHPAYNWFGVGATARVDLNEPGQDTSSARASRAIGVAEVVTPDDPSQDEAVRRLVVALVRQGVTSTVSRHDGPRYGVLHIDSNLPDVRLAIGGPDENEFVGLVLDAADAAYRAELERQLAADGHARLWVPDDGAPDVRAEDITDLRKPRDLPVLIVAGKDAASTAAALDALIADLDDGAISVAQPADLDGGTGTVGDRTVAILNRGMPGFNVEADGSLYLSLMRSCSGWPSGVWIDPPRRSTPDGANFQFQHWTHRFEYALAAAAGDWRDGGIVRVGHEYNNPFETCVLENHPGTLPATASFVEVQPPSAVLTVLKPAGVAPSRMAGMETDPTAGVAMRVYESSGRPTDASIRFRWPVNSAGRTNALEETEAQPLDMSGSSIAVRLDPYEIATVAAAVQPKDMAAEGEPGSTDLGQRAEAAQPVFSDYWLHNKGSAPMGYQPVTVQIKPSFLTGGGPFTLPVVVASERTDSPVAGSVELIVPPGWDVSPTERIYRLAPGAHLALDAVVTASAETAAGRYFVAARITDDAGQSHEDVVTIDYRADDGAGSQAEPTDQHFRSTALSWAVERTLTTAGLEPVDQQPNAGAIHDRGGELLVELVAGAISITTGRPAILQVRISNSAASEVRGEAQILSPLETWSTITPWTQGFTVEPGSDTVIGFDVAPPRDAIPGSYWALVKVMYFGRLLYTESVEVIIEAP